jgi:hypothetical protein
MIFVTADDAALAPIVDLMKDVRQRLLMHRLVLENRIRSLTSDELRHARILNPPELEHPLDAIVTLAGKPSHRFARGPIRPLVAIRLVQTCGIDAALEEPLEHGIERGFAERAFVEGEKAECRDVPFVKRERMAQRNRAIVERVAFDQRKERRRSFAVAPIPIDEVGAECRDYSVPRFSCSRSIETKSALKFPLPNERLPLR